MREIKFRALDLKGNWVYGFLIDISAINDKQSGFRIYERLSNGGIYHFVKLETIGQSTGLKDKNGKEIFEGDIFKVVFADILYQVIFDDNHAIFGFKSFDKKRSKVRIFGSTCNIEVIGNIYENTELLTPKKI